MERISHYEIVEKLGEGGMGVVYKARDPRLNRFVAIKVLPPSKVDDLERRARFAQEAKSASALNHPNIVTIHDIGDQDGSAYIVMEYIEGRPLSDSIPKQGMALKEALRCAIPIADALARAHESGVVHRDLKPANVMLAKDGTVKLVDFGLAKLLEKNVGAGDSTLTMHNTPHTQAGAVMGTVAYMSPEQAEGKPVDARSDVFSFGSMLYEMLSGQKAFDGGSAARTMAAILQSEPPAVPSAPRELERLVARCLRKEPARRWQSMADLRSTLEELKLDFESGTLSGSTQVADFARVPTRAGWKLWLAAAAGIGALVALTIYSMRPTPPQSIPSGLQAVPLTAYTGSERLATFAPDGSQVAFAWDGDKQENFDIYVKRISSGPPLRITDDPEQDDSPAWSPDGSQIAYVHRTAPGQFEVRIVAPLGGPSRALFTIPFAGGGDSRALDWSPDGKWLAAGAGSELWIVSVETGERKVIPAAAGVHSPLFSADGKRLVYAAGAANATRLWEVALTPAFGAASAPTPKQVVGQINSNPTWIGGGGEILMNAGTPGDVNLVRILAAGEGAKVSLAVTQSGQDYHPALSKSGTQLVFTKGTREIDIYRVDLGKSTAAALITSTRYERFPAYSPDGTRIAFASQRSGAWQLWASDADGNQAVQLTTESVGEIRDIHWSPDGRQIGFSAPAGGRYQAFTVEAAGGKPKQVELPGSSGGGFAWSSDGKWFLYSGDGAAWRAPVAGGARQEVLKQQGRFFGSGKRLYFAADVVPELVVYQLGDDGSRPQEIFRAGQDANVDTFAAAANGIYYAAGATVLGPGRGRCYDFGSRAVRPVDAIASPSQFGFSVSPDGKYLLYAKETSTGSDLMLVDNFK